MIWGCAQQESEFNFQTDSLQLSIDKKGFVSHFIDLKSGNDYAQKDSLSPLLAPTIKLPNRRAGVERLFS